MERTKYPSENYDRKKFKKINLTIALNVISAKNEKIYLICVSKNNSNCKNQVVLLTIPNKKGWHYIAASALLRRISSKHNGELYCLNCIHLVRTKDKPESHKKEWENKDFNNVVMPSEDTKVLEFNQYQPEI